LVIFTLYNAAAFAIIATSTGGVKMIKYEARVDMIIGMAQAISDALYDHGLPPLAELSDMDFAEYKVSLGRLVQRFHVTANGRIQFNMEE
jgi:hypothetical protein